MRKGCIAGLLNRITTSAISLQAQACSFPYKYLERGMPGFQTTAASKDHSQDLKKHGPTVLEGPHKATELFFITISLFFFTGGETDRSVKLS